MKTTNSKATATNKEVKTTSKSNLASVKAKAEKAKITAQSESKRKSETKKVQNVPHQAPPAKKSGLADKLTKAEDKLKKDIAVAKETEKPVVTATQKTTPAKTTRQVGDIHPNGLWVWKEIKEGKFDWRTIPSDKAKVSTPKADKPAKTSTPKASKAVTKEPAKLTIFLKNRIKTEVTEKLKDVKDFKHALWAKQTDNRLYVEFNKASKVKPEKLASIQAELAEEYKDLTVVFEVRKSLN